MAGKPGMLQSMGLQRMEHSLVTEQSDIAVTSAAEPHFIEIYLA